MPRSSATSHELARIELLAGLPGQTIAQLAKRMEREEIAPGTAVVREGEDGDRFYVVFAGMLSVSQRDLGNQGVLRPGDFFGEVALAMDVPRTATVTARDDCLLYALDRESFLCAVSSHPCAASAARALATTRLESVPVA